MFETGSADPNRFGPAPGARSRTQSGSISRTAIAAAVGDALKRAKDDKLLIQILRKEADSAALSKEQRRKACVALAPLLDRNGDFAGAAFYWRRALKARFDPGDGFKAALAQIKADKGDISADTAGLLNSVLSRAPKNFPERHSVEQYLALAATE